MVESERTKTPPLDAATAEGRATKRRRRAKRTGVVISNAMQKSVVVSVERTVTHPLYQRIMRRSTKLMAHDEKNLCQRGDKVLIEECRPLSSRKRWVVKRILRSSATGSGGKQS